jgi:hypothetical protein
MVKECKVTKLFYTAYPKNSKSTQMKLKFECGLLLSLVEDEVDTLRGFPSPIVGDTCCPKHANNTKAIVLRKVKKQTKGDIPEVECQNPCYDLQNKEQASTYWKLIGANGSD